MTGSQNRGGDWGGGRERGGGDTGGPQNKKLKNASYSREKGELPPPPKNRGNVGLSGKGAKKLSVLT